MTTSSCTKYCFFLDLEESYNNQYKYYSMEQNSATTTRFNVLQHGTQLHQQGSTNWYKYYGMEHNSATTTRFNVLQHGTQLHQQGSTNWYKYYGMEQFIVVQYRVYEKWQRQRKMPSAEVEIHLMYWCAIFKER